MNNPQINSLKDGLAWFIAVVVEVSFHVIQPMSRLAMQVNLGRIESDEMIITMLSETNNIPPPAALPDSSSDNHSPPSGFIIATTIINTVTSVVALEIAIGGLVQSIRKKKLEEGEEEQR